MADLLSLSEAAKLLKITEDELRTLAQESKINGVRSDDGFSFKEAELQRYADEQGITRRRCIPIGRRGWSRVCHHWCRRHR